MTDTKDKIPSFGGIDHKDIAERLANIQAKLKAPKNQENKFGGYKYRSCEDILEAVKPLLKEEAVVLTISDTIEEVGGRIYVKATASIMDGWSTISTTAYAREAEARKGMDDSQVTGSASSYARKYALNGLFAIDDTKDADATNTHEKGQNEAQALDNRPATTQQLEKIKKTVENIAALLTYYKVDRLEDLTFGQARDAISRKERQSRGE